MSSLNKKQKKDDPSDKNYIDYFSKILGKHPVMKTLNDLMGNGRRTFLVEVKIRFKYHRQGTNKRWNYGRNVFLDFEVNPQYLFHTRTHPYLKDEDGNPELETINTGKPIEVGFRYLKNIHVMALNEIGDIICDLGRDRPFVINDPENYWRSPNPSVNIAPGTIRGKNVYLYHPRPDASYMSLRGATATMRIFYKNKLSHQLPIMSFRNHQERLEFIEYRTDNNGDLQPVGHIVNETLTMYHRNPKQHCTFTDTFANKIGCTISEDGKQITGMNNIPNSFHSNILNLTNNTRFTVTEYDFEFYENTIYNYCSNMDFPMLVIRYMFVPENNYTPLFEGGRKNGQEFLKQSNPLKF